MNVPFEGPGEPKGSMMPWGPVEFARAVGLYTVNGARGMRCYTKPQRKVNFSSSSSVHQQIMLAHAAGLVLKLELSQLPFPRATYAIDLQPQYFTR